MRPACTTPGWEPARARWGCVRAALRATGSTTAARRLRSCRCPWPPDRGGRALPACGGSPRPGSGWGLRSPVPGVWRSVRRAGRVRRSPLRGSCRGWWSSVGFLSAVQRDVGEPSRRSGRLGRFGAVGAARPVGGRQTSVGLDRRQRPAGPVGLIEKSSVRPTPAHTQSSRWPVLGSPGGRAVQRLRRPGWRAAARRNLGFPHR